MDKNLGKGGRREFIAFRLGGRIYGKGGIIGGKVFVVDNVGVNTF